MKIMLNHPITIVIMKEIIERIIKKSQLKESLTRDNCFVEWVLKVPLKDSIK